MRVVLVMGLDFAVLIGLMVGSEGTLGVFSKVTLKLLPLPKSSDSGVGLSRRLTPRWRPKRLPR